MSVRMEQIAWKESLLAQLVGLGDDGLLAGEYIHAHKTYIGFWKARKNVGTFWTLPRSVHFNSLYYSMQTEVNNFDMLTLLIHEVKHLQQGIFLALSVYGELEAWQLQFCLYHQLNGKSMHPVIVEMMALLLEYDRAVLRHARDLMNAYAGKGYRADLLPVYPWGKRSNIG